MERPGPFILLLFALPVQAQNWCAPGATWTYTLATFGAQGYSQFTYDGDTVIAGSSCQQIPWRLVYYDYVTESTVDAVFDTLYTTVNADLVSIWDGIAFDTLYHFGAAPGDHWQLTNEGGLPGGQAVTVLDTGTNVIDGLPLRYLIVDQGWGPSDTIHERIGGLFLFMVPWWNGMVDGLAGPLRCYSDVEMNYTAPWLDVGCTSILAIAEEVISGSLTIVPNPGTDHFTMELPEEKQIVQVLDVTGRMVHLCPVPGRNATVDTSSWPPGCYTIRTAGAIRATRWVKY